MDDEQDQLLPIANVGRVMKQHLPPAARVSKEAKQRMQECATEFISFVTSEASNKCRTENRKTVNGDDVCWALSSLGFDDYADTTVRYLHKYREAERAKADQKKATDSDKVIKDEESNHTSCQAAQQQTDQIPEPTLLEFRKMDEPEPDIAVIYCNSDSVENGKSAGLIAS
ncbi:hypothetical protein POTOM_044980 [Populus tomentosa]|uniref:Transcription factor CBF/NF-Y/archaeal histone domain-containing protein n=1 Tax=Populus tomentosa TaxID=118781 RepID=A0A8X8CCN8_POPTO|nr:hypothetical protein POTOM_044980 [Populus tomentosa]